MLAMKIEDNQIILMHPPSVGKTNSEDAIIQDIVLAMNAEAKAGRVALTEKLVQEVIDKGLSLHRAKQKQMLRHPKRQVATGMNGTTGLATAAALSAAGSYGAPTRNKKASKERRKEARPAWRR